MTQYFVFRYTSSGITTILTIASTELQGTKEVTNLG